jgi:hypothetical protein
LRFTVTITNTADVTKIVYPWTAAIDVESGEVAQGDTKGYARDILPSRWVEMSRAGIAIPMGESHEIPILVTIDPNAKPGNYHAVLHFSPGPNAGAAHANTDESADVMLNVIVDDDANERLQLAAFTPDKNFFSGVSPSFTYKIENIGNRGIVPKGKVRIYDRKGEEIATVDANTQGTKLEPNAKLALASVWAAGAL